MGRKNLLVVIISCAYMNISFSQELSVDLLLKDFQSNNWPAVLKAKEDLENLEGKSIPKLMNLLSVNSVRKLENTGDLIYPGAERFYGRGQIIEYDIDDISIRAGWLLEELTFQNFGFIGVHIQEDKLVDFIKFTFPDYYNNSSNRKKLETGSAIEKRRIIESLSIKAVNEWWVKESDNWNRLNALLDALNSDDEKRQVKALFYIRNGKTKCTGLTESFYKAKIQDRIIELSKVQLKRVSEHAKLILLDLDYEWLKIKQM